MNWNDIKPWGLAVGVAIAYNFMIAMFWGLFAAHNPIFNWLVDTYAVTDPALFKSAVWVHDILVNVLLALPFAFLITRISPDRRWAYVALAVLLIFTWQYRLVLFEIGLSEFAAHGNEALFGMIFTFVYLPVVLLLATLLERRRTAV